jgi:hypothetical protein
MKNLSPLWFIKPPLDIEHKEYVLLDYLKSLGDSIRPENCYSTLKTLSKIVKDLNHFKLRNEIPKDRCENLSKEETKILNKFNYLEISDDERNNLDIIIENSLETLYQYSNLCLEVLKMEENKIKIFKIEPKKNLGTERTNSGILIVRNMVSDKIFPYVWQGSVTLKTEEGDKKICLLKKVFIKNQTYSLNYEYVYHEILKEGGIKNSSPELFVVEIYENFDEESEIYKLAKEKFIEEIS